MKVLKRVAGVILVLLLVLFLEISPCNSMTVKAATGGKTSRDAVNWALNHGESNSPLDYDGWYGEQCVDLIMYYYNYLNNSIVGGNGMDYATNAVPEGWNRIRYYNGFVPKAGDIAVWTTGGGGNGHVAIVISANASTMTVVDQNSPNPYCVVRSDVATSGIWGVIRPDFPENTAAPTSTKIWLEKSQLKIGEEFTINLSANMNCNFYISIFDYDSGEKILSENTTTIYKNSFSKAGHYRAYMSAFNANGSVDSDWVDFYVFGSPPTIATLSTDKSEIGLGEAFTLSTSTNAYYARIYTSIYVDNESGTGSLAYCGDIPYNFTYTPSSAGVYNAHISAYTHEGSVDSNWVSIHVGKYSVKYEANGGSGAPSSQTKSYGKSLKLSSTEPTRAGYTFGGWSLSDTATNVAYQPGDSYNNNANVTLYAVWVPYTPVQQNGWAQENGEWCYYVAGTKATNGWKNINGYWYYFDVEGVMQTGWQQVNGKWYYLESGGAMQTGWVKDGSNWYYLNSSGVMQTGWQQINGKWYYLESGGAMQTGWMKDGSNWYYLNSSGAMQTGWVKDGSNWYYLNSSGVMLTGTYMINGKTYTFNSSGVWVA